MGQLRFIIPRPDRIAPDTPQRAYIAGAEGIPWECRNLYQNGVLAIDRDTRESGNLYFPWHIEGYGEWMLASASLMERPRPYNLPVELARGTLNRLRNQSASWVSAGMQLSESYRTAYQGAMEAFSRAATGQFDPLAAADHAEESLQRAFEAVTSLGQDYTQQVLNIRRSHGPMTTLLAARIDAPLEKSIEKKYLAAFNTALVAPNWREIEPSSGEFEWDALDRQVQWCKDKGLRVCMGPLMSLDKRTVPDWLYLWEGDFEEIQSYLDGFVQKLVERYRGRIHLWHVGSRVNVPGAISFNEEERLKLTVDALHRVRSLDARTPTIVSFDQPWAEYIAREDQELSPIHFADTLVRGELGLAGVGLELNIGYWPGGTLPRDVLEVSRQLDRWTQLGVPLVVFLSVPSSQGMDPLAKHGGMPLSYWISGGLSPKTQQHLVSWLLPLLLSKQAVQAIVWNQFRDDVPHEFSHGGLLDARRRAKPALETIAELRRHYLA